MKTKHPKEIIDLRHQLDHITPQKLQTLQEYGADPDNATLSLILFRRREKEVLSDGNKLIEVKVNEMKNLIFKYLMTESFLKNDTMDNSEIQRIYKYPIYPRSSKIDLAKGFVKIDVGRMGGSHWTCFIFKDNKGYYFDSFGVQPDEFLLKQLHKPILYHSCKIQDINSRLCGSNCLYFFYQVERMN